MAKPKNIDLTVDGVITQEALLAYAEGRLNDSERAQMDKLLKDDPFAQEALDGLRQAPSPATIPAAITSINTLLREKTGLREKKKKGIEIHWANYAYAAVVLGVLVGVGFVMIHVLSNNHHEIAMSKPESTAQESVPIIEQKKRETPVADTIAAVTTIATTDTIALNKPIQGGVNTEASGAAKDASPEKKAETTEAKVDKSAGYAQSQSDLYKSKNTMTPEVAAQLGVAKTYFETSDYVNAEKKYSEILASQPDNADALYFGGVSAYLNGSKGLGEPNFDKLIKAGLYTEGTKWYKANILIKKGKKEEAKQLLRDLINSNSYFKDRAVKQYEELYK